MSKKYASLTTLQTFLNNLKNLFATKEEIDSKADATHNHNDIYYTETEVDEKLATKSNSTHNHDSAYDLKGSANTALDTAKEYTDTKTSSLASTTVVDTKISTHNASTSAHNDIRALITDLATKLNNFLDVDDTTTDQLSEVLTLIENNKGTLESLTTSKINVSDIVNNLTTNSTGKVLSAAQGVEIKSLIDALQIEIDSHTHGIADVSGLQVQLDNKVTLDTAQTIIGTKTFDAPANIAGAEQTTVKIKTSNGGALVIGKEGTNSGTMMRFEQTEGTTRLKFRSSSVTGAMVWEQPEQGAQLFVDLGERGADYHRITFPSKDGTLALTTVASTSANGLMSASDKSKLDGIDSGANKTVVDSALNSSSINPVQNAVVSKAINTINETYETKSDATAKLNEAKTYADNAADAVKNDLLGNAGGAYDTLKELGDLIDTNHDAIEALETVASGKADKTHTHTEATTSESGFLSVENKTQLNNGGSPIIKTSGTGAAYTATVSGITTLTAGIHFIMIPHTVSTAAAPTLNVNGLGAKSIRRRTTQATTSTATGYAASWLSANKPIRVEYDGTFWIADLPKPLAADLSGTLTVKNGGTGKATVTSGNYLVGNGTSAMTEKTPAEVLSDIGAAALVHSHEQSDINGLVELLATFPRMATGEYTGTNTFGMNNPNSLTFDFVPDLIIISGWGNADSSTTLKATAFIYPTANYPFGLTYARAEGKNGDLYVSVEGTTVRWYGYNVVTQMNAYASNVHLQNYDHFYRYTAFGLG